MKRLYARHGPQLRRLQPRARTRPPTRPKSRGISIIGSLRSNPFEQHLGTSKERCPRRHQHSVLLQPWYLQRFRRLPPLKLPVMLMRKHSRWVQQERAKSKVRPRKLNRKVQNACAQFFGFISSNLSFFHEATAFTRRKIRRYLSTDKHLHPRHTKIHFAIRSDAL